MSLLTRLRHALLGRPQPRVERLPAVEQTVMRVDELPPFSLHIADLMRYDPQVRIGLGTRNGLLMAAEVEVVGDDGPLVRWVQHQWNSLWSAEAHHLLKAKLYGFMPFEVVYRQAMAGEFRGLIEVERLVDLAPRDVRLLVAGEKIVGLTHEPAGQTPVDLLAPQALVCTFDAGCTNPYGCALLARAYPAWYEKWMPGGVKRTLRLRMVKDAYVGDILWYPPNQQVETTDGRTVSWQQMAREIVASRISGSTLTLPMLYDTSGNKLIDYTPPQDVRGATQIFRWKRDLDLEIWKALEVPPEIIQASTTGSGYSGRWIPFAVALSAVHAELAELVRAIDRDILRPIAQLNFGRMPEYQIRAHSLVETYARMWGE